MLQTPLKSQVIGYHRRNTTQNGILRTIPACKNLRGESREELRPGPANCSIVYPFNRSSSKCPLQTDHVAIRANCRCHCGHNEKTGKDQARRRLSQGDKRGGSRNVGGVSFGTSFSSVGRIDIAGRRQTAVARGGGTGRPR